MNNWKKRPVSTVREAVEYNSGYSAKDIELSVCKEYDLYLDVIAHKCLCSENIFVYGDYDADGCTSAAILSLIFDAININYKVFLPCRFNQGYGISYENIKDNPDYKKCDTVITIDNGIVANECIDKIKDDKKFVIIMDHHAASDDAELPNAELLVDPIAESGTYYEFRDYCAAGIAYKLAEYFASINMINEHTLNKCAVMAMIGTIGDVVPLIADNRKIVMNGLEILKKKTNTFQKDFLEKHININPRTTAEDIAFNLVPMINAPGRMIENGAMRLYELMMDILNAETEEKFIEKNIEERLVSFKDINSERKKLCKEFQKKAYEDYLKLPEMNPVVIKTAAPEGILGIIAGGLAEIIKKTVFVFGKTKNELLKGSARSFGDFHIKNYMNRHKDCFIKYGGHANAGGYTADDDGYKKLFEIATSEITKEDTETNNVIYYDLDVEEGSLLSAYTNAEAFEPYGEGFPAPIIRTKISLVPKNKVLYAALGEDKSTLKLNGNNIKVLGFGMYKKFIEMGTPLVVDVIGSLHINYYKGKEELQLNLIDFKPVVKEKKENELLYLINRKVKEKNFK